MMHPKPTSTSQRVRRIKRQGLTFLQGSLRVWESRPHQCEDCGKPIPVCRAHNIHHVTHRKHGGTNNPENLRLVCATCHDGKHGLKPPKDDWRDR